MRISIDHDLGHSSSTASCKVSRNRRLGIPTPAQLRPQTVAESQIMRQIIAHVQVFAKSTAPVLITGESGTGKEVIAQLIHQASLRPGHYVRVNCAALSESLIESELFGHERGAFTGAADHRVGRIEWADEGSLLLDEISEIPTRLQAKLLRVLEEEEFQRVGSNESRSVNARIIATSNRRLEDEVAKGAFREDLFYRLNVLQIDVPPLRERRQDIPPLAEAFLEHFREAEQCRARRFSSEALTRLAAFDWPGNVRQLRNLVRRVCVLADSELIHVSDLPDLSQHGLLQKPDLFEMTLKQAERLLIQSSLRRHNRNRTAAARHLGVTARTLHNRLKQDPDLDP